MKKASEELYRSACELMPGGVSSPVRAGSNLWKHPIYIVRGEGPIIYDVDGNRYIDMCCCWGANICGHAHPEVVKHATEYIERGLHFGACHPLEIDMAQKIITMYGKIEMVRFVNSGTEATMSAIRVARAHTRRKKIIKFDGCYHGHYDGFLVKAGSGVSYLPEASSDGIPSETISNTLVLPLNDTHQFNQYMERYGYEVAAVIIEGIPANMGIIPLDTDFVHNIRKQCSKYGALMILDEVITGFRIGRGGASSLYNVVPDIVCFGKIIGGGLPVGAYASTKQIMGNVAPLGTVYQAGTLSGNPIALASGISQLTIIERTPDFYDILWKRTKYIADTLTDAFNSKGYPGVVISYPGMLWIGFGIPHPPKNASEVRNMDTQMFKLVFNYLIGISENKGEICGVYLPPSPYEVLFTTISHTDSIIEEVASKIRDAFAQSLDKKTLMRHL